MQVVTTMVLGAILAVSAFSFAPGSARAHGAAMHAKKKEVFDPAKVENMAFGRVGDPAKVTRVIRVGMDDKMHFTSGDLRVRKGQTVRFVVRNDGKLMHEMVIGTMKELNEHAEMMRKFPAMEHDGPYMAHVAPGKEDELVWQFTKAGEFYYACLIPGHLEAGMISKITVK